MSTVTSSTSRSLTQKLSERWSVLDFGAKGDGVTNDAPAINAAIAQAHADGGRELYFPGGFVYAIGSRIHLQASHRNITLVGDGPASVLKRTASITAGQGLLDIHGQSLAFRSLQIDGNVTSSTALQYGASGGFGDDPMSSALTNNSSCWVHSGAARIRFEDVTITHTGGYSCLIDADTADVSDVLFSNCKFINNRPHKFGTTLGDLNYGSWTSGILYRGDCRTSAGKPYSVKGLRVSGCSFSRHTGNCIWGHSLGFDVHHEGVVIEGNTFEFIGRDAYLAGNVQGGSCYGNVARYVGFMHSTDSDTPVAAYLANHYAVGFDASGYVSNHPFIGNSVIEFYGGGFDLDGLRDSVVSNNTVSSSQAISKGLQTGDTSVNGGGHNLILTGNRFNGCNAGAIILNQAEGCICENNQIDHPTGAILSPIVLYSLDKQTKNNIVRGNQVTYAADWWIITESDNGTGTGFDATTVNTVYGNTYIGARGEFLAHALSGSRTGITLSTNSTAATTRQESTLQREGTSATSAFKLYDKQGATQKQYAQMQFSNALWNISEDGAAQTGIITTGARSTLGYNDAVWTGKLMSDGFIAAYDYAGAATSYNATHANSLDANWALLRFNKASGIWEQSVSVSAGARVWSSMTGSSGLSGLTAGRIPYVSSATTLTDSANLIWDNTAKVMTVTGVTGTASIVAATSYIQSAEGFLTTSSSSTAVNAQSGGVTALSLISIRNDGAAGLSLYRTSATARAYGQGVTSSGSWFLSDITAGSNRITMDTAGLVTIGTTVSINQTGSITASGTIQGLGVNVTGTAYNSLQVASGGLYCGLGLTTDQALYAKSYAASTSLNTPAAGYGGLAHKSGGQYWYYTGSAWATVDLSTVGTGSISGLTTNRIPYATSATALGNTALTWDNANTRLGVNKAAPGTTLHVGGQGYFDGAATGAGLTVADGYVESVEGYYSGFTSYQTFQAPSGGMYARSLRALVYSQVGQNSGAPTATSGDSLVAGAIYWDTLSSALKVYNGAAWTNVAGITSINSQTGPSISISNGTGISISSVSNTVTISNGGVTQVFGTTNQVSVNANTGSVTFSLPQSINTSANVTFGSVLTSDAIQSNRSTGPSIYAPNAYMQSKGFVSSGLATYNSIQTDAGISCGTGSGGGYYVGATQVINTSGQFVGPGISMLSNGIAASGFNPYVGGLQYTGQSWDINIPGGFTITGFGGTYTKLIFKGGSLVSAS